VISACSALKEYQVSDPVKTDSGWYILLRLPTTADDVVTYVSDTQVRTLRYYAAVSQYDAVVSGWIDDAKVEYQGDFAKFDLPALLKKSK
jgi:parvulin-like peptidyl-prolyl isomerase